MNRLEFVSRTNRGGLIPSLMNDVGALGRDSGAAHNLLDRQFAVSSTPATARDAHAEVKSSSISAAVSPSAPPFSACSTVATKARFRSLSVSIFSSMLPSVTRR